MDWLPQDSLASMARLLGAVLGPRHAVTAMLAEAAEANMSSATRSTLQERERIQQVRPEQQPDRAFGPTEHTCVLDEAFHC